MKYFLFVLLLLCVSGCNSNVSISGTVTFPDGRPLTKGTVVFQSKTHIAKGELNNSGYYRLGSLSKYDGLPPDTYKVYVSGAGATPEGFVAPPGSDESGYVPWIDSRFRSAETTPLSCDITKGQTFDFQVEPYIVKKKK
jgi:hypothetical protein